MTDPLPFPPIEMRMLVGPTDLAAFDNPTGAPVFPDIPSDAGRRILDFGCGCGRLARQLLQQQPRPERYVGLDLHRGMVNWCQRNLTPEDAAFQFLHHDVFDVSFNPGGHAAEDLQPFPVADGAFDLVNAWSVFTHLVEEQIPHYIHESIRVLAPGGYLRCTWFLFDKRYFPMMQDFQNVLYINRINPTNAVIVDAEWLRRVAADAGLVITYAAKPSVRGFQWVLHLRRASEGHEPVDLPADDAPFGHAAPPVPDFDTSQVGT